MTGGAFKAHIPCFLHIIIFNGFIFQPLDNYKQTYKDLGKHDVHFNPSGFVYNHLYCSQGDEKNSTVAGQTGF